MKVIVAGSRVDMQDFPLVTRWRQEVTRAILESSFPISEVVSGTARGVDKFGEEWAERTGIPVKRFPAQWDTFGKRAGYLRNEQMAHYADALVAVWDGQSKGTKHMIETMQKLNKKVCIHIYENLENN